MLKAGYSAKAIRSRLFMGVNLSRSIGDVNETEVNGKPEITVMQLKKGDVVVLACDGLFDYSTDAERTQIVAERINRSIFRRFINWVKSFFGYTLATDLVNHAIYMKKAKDNVTVLTMKISA